MKEFQDYITKLSYALSSTDARTAIGAADVSWARKGDGTIIEYPMHRVIGSLRGGFDVGARAFVIGNGGSAAIASHVANDMNTAGIRAMALNDASALTCLSNDFGYEHVFSKQLEWHGKRGDTLIAISSSGESINIIMAVEAAIKTGMFVVTLSGFAPDNDLRSRGDLNFYVPSSSYGFVEMAHHVILHAITDELREAPWKT